MARRKKLGLVPLLVAISHILAGIAVGMGMVSGVIAVPIVGVLVNQIAGWVVVAGGVLAGLKALKLM